MAKNNSGIYKDKERGTYYIDKDYKKIRIKKRGFNSLNEAKAYLSKEMYNIDHPVILETKTDATLDELFSVYIEYRSINVRITTLKGNKDKYRIHIQPEFGDVLLSSLNPNKIRDWKIKLVKMEFSEDFTNQTIMVFRNLIQFGIDRDYNVNKKALSELDKVNINKIPQERAIWSYEQIDQFLDTFNKEDKQELMYWEYFYAFSRSGMRPNEFRGLQVKDLRFNSINVNHDITSKIAGHGDIIQPCKNNYSIRDVLMPDDIMKILKDRTAAYEPTDFVFGKKTALRETNIRRVLDMHTKLAKLPHITIYGFRHSHATHLIRNGVMIKVVSSRLGHKDIQTTLNTYQHLLKDDQESVLKLL